MKQLLKTKLSNICIVSTVEIEPAKNGLVGGLYETSTHDNMVSKFSHFYISKEAC